MANTGVFGGPLNILAPKVPGKISPSLLGSSRYSITNSAGSTPFGKSKGQKGDESH